MEAADTVASARVIRMKSENMKGSCHMEQSKINRINELAKKAKEVGLTVEEQEERALLRKEYIAAFKNNLKSTLDSIVIVDEHGNRRALRKDN